MSEEEKGRRSHPPVSRTPTGVAEGGIPRKYFFLPSQSNLLAETGIINPVHVGEWLHANRTRLNHVGINPKVQRRYLGYRDIGVHMKGGGGGDRYPY